MDTTPDTPTNTMDKPFAIIEAKSGWQPLDLRDMWQYRDLLTLLVWRNLTVQYKQSVLGPFWALVNPVMSVFFFTIVFGELAQLPSDGIPYPLFSFAAMIPWGFFQSSFTGTVNSITGQVGLMRKVYFPRLILPFSTVFGTLGNVMITFTFLVIVIIVYVSSVPVHTIDQLNPFGLATVDITTVTIEIRPLRWLILPVLMVVAGMLAMGMGLWLGVLNARFRDVGQIMGYLGRGMLYLTPIVYPSSILQGPTKLLLYVNPLAGVVDGFRWALLGTDTLPGPWFFFSSILAVVIFWTGLLYFRRSENLLIDMA